MFCMMHSQFTQGYEECYCGQVKPGILVDMVLAGHSKVNFEREIHMKYKHGIVKTRQISHSFIQPALI